MTLLCYHSVACGWADPVSIEPVDFERQCAVLARRQRVVPLASMIDRLAAGSALPAAADVLTFDDGFADFARFAVPILRRHRLPATMYVVAGSIPDEALPVTWITGLDPRDAPPLLTTTEIKELHADGWSFGSHSMFHRDLPTLSEAECLTDLHDSRELLSELLGEPVRTLAYPFGRHAPHVRRAAEKAGYDLALALPNAGAEDGGRFAVPRTGIYRGNGMLRFRMKTSRAFPALRGAPGYAAAAAAARKLR